MATVGARELKTRLGRYLKLVRAGATLIVTDRGRPVAELRPIEPARDDEQAVLEELVALGVCSRATADALQPFVPLDLPGTALSETLLEEREDRL